PSASPADEEIRAGVGDRKEADPLRGQQQLPSRRSVPAVRSKGERFADLGCGRNGIHRLLHGLRRAGRGSQPPGPRESDARAGVERHDLWFRVGRRGSACGSRLPPVPFGPPQVLDDGSRCDVVRGSARSSRHGSPPDPGFLGGLRKVATEIGALLIFDEVKTCGKWYAGAEEAFGVTPDVKVLGKAIGGGFPLAAVGGPRSIMDQVVPGQIGHAGTFNANPLSISAGLVTMTKILTRSGMRHAQQIGDDLAKGYRDIIGDHGLEMVVQSGGISGTVHIAHRQVTDWRSFQDVDVGRWWGYFTAMLNRGIVPMATGADEQWTSSVAHTKSDV